MLRTLSSSKGNVDFLWKGCSIKGPPQACRGEFRSLGEVVGLVSLGFLSSCMSTCGKARVSKGQSDLLWLSEGHLRIPWALLQGWIGPHVELMWEPQGSSPFLMSIAGSLLS